MYRNIMEIFVEDYYDKIKDSLDCCTCEQCRGDVIALALNRLPTKYVNRSGGEIVVSTKINDQEHQNALHTAVLQAVEIVKKSPRHETRQK